MAILRRRRGGGDDNVLDYDRVRPALRLAALKVARSEGLDKEQRKALLVALKNEDILEAAVAASDTSEVEAAEGRDWATFFEALTNFIVAILPLIMQIISAMGGVPV